MNTRLKTVVTFALVVVLSAGLAMAGRGGGGGHGGGGGGSHGGGGGGHAGGGGGGGYHAPSFSTPHQSFSSPHQSFNTSRQTFNTARPAETPASRLSLPQNTGANRAAFTPGSRPGTGERPGIANTPDWDNRLNARNRANIDNRANIGNRAYVANRPNLSNNFNINRTNNFVRPTHGDWNRGDWYHGDWHGNWNNSWNYGPVGWWGAGYWAGDALSAIPWSWGYWPYYNPYYGGSFVAGSAFDYSQPIVVAQAPVAPAGAPAGLTAEQQATPLFDAARNAFMQGDYKTALAQVDQAIAQVPNDTVLHEFRGLALFALGRYKEAAAADYAVLSAGPGWDWTTLSALYPNVEVYTAQLRALEQYAKSHPATSDAKFLLAENYLTCGYTDAAAAQFKEVVQLDPKDQLSAQLLKSISAPGATEQATPSQPAAPAKPADAASLVGNWTATRADSATIKLALANDGKFTWELDQNGKPQQFSGTYTVADNLLVLKQSDNPMMVGQVASLASDRFNFKLAGDNPSDPGLTFVR
ncbi:MAG: tetratricopeptide repeat protein [Thermoguttaceae bacterium]